MSDGDNVINLRPTDEELMAEFLKGITESDMIIRPALFFGWDKDKRPVLHIVSMPWRDLALLKVFLDEHISFYWHQN